MVNWQLSSPEVWGLTNLGAKQQQNTTKHELCGFSRLCFYQTRSAWSRDQGSNKNHSPAYNFAPTVTKFCVMWEGLSLPHDTKFGNCRCKIVDSRVFPIWSLIHGSSWSGLIKAEPDVLHVCDNDTSKSTWLWFNSLAPGRFERNFHANFSDQWLRYLMWNCPQMNFTGLHWWSVNIGSGNGLVLSGSKPLPEPMLTQISVAKWRH